MPTPRYVLSTRRGIRRRSPRESRRQTIRLKTIAVSAQPRLPIYRIPRTGTATGTNTPTLDVPRSIRVIPRQVLIDQGAQSLEGAVPNAPGVYGQQSEGNRGEFCVRGVKTKSDSFVDGLRDDNEYYRPLYNVAHVDVRQGPAAVLFGRGGAGDVINPVRKKPERAPIRHLSIDAGPWGEWCGTLDAGNAVGQSGAFRQIMPGTPRSVSLSLGMDL